MGEPLRTAAGGNTADRDPGTHHSGNHRRGPPVVPFPQDREQIIRNYRWLNGRWSQRASERRTVNLARWHQCREFLQAWLNTHAGQHP